MSRNAYVGCYRVPREGRPTRCGWAKTRNLARRTMAPEGASHSRTWRVDVSTQRRAAAGSRPAVRTSTVGSVARSNLSVADIDPASRRTVTSPRQRERSLFSVSARLTWPRARSASSSGAVVDTVTTELRISLGARSILTSAEAELPANTALPTRRATTLLCPTIIRRDGSALDQASPRRLLRRSAVD